MGCPVAPAWLLGRRQLNQSQIGLWTASYEYIFLRLHTQENTSRRERAEAIYYDSYYNVDITGTPAPRFRSTEHSHFFRCFTCTSYFSFFFLILFLSPLPHYPSFSLLLFPLSLFLLSSQPSGHRVSFKVLILIWNLLQSAQHWTWNTGLRDLIRACEHACLCSDGFLLQFKSKIINETPGTVVVKHVRWCIVCAHYCCVYWRLYTAELLFYRKWSQHNIKQPPFIWDFFYVCTELVHLARTRLIQSKTTALKWILPSLI